MKVFEYLGTVRFFLSSECVWWQFIDSIAELFNRLWQLTRPGLHDTWNWRLVLDAEVLDRGLRVEEQEGSIQFK